MPSSNVEVVEIGIPGPPGSGISAAEKATYVTLTTANTFTAAQTVQVSNSFVNAFSVIDQNSRKTLHVSTGYHYFAAVSGGQIRGFSDDLITETFVLNASTGAAQFDSTVSALRHIGESIELTLPAIDGGGSVITTEIKYDFKVPYNLTVTEWTLLGDQSGSIGIEFWKDTYANFPPTVADLVSGTTGTNNPRIVTTTKGQSATLTNWTTTWVQGDIIRVNVASITTLTRCGIGLKVLKT